MAKPMRLDVLIHEIEYHEFDGDSPYGDGYKAPVVIKNVRVGPDKRVQVTTNNETFVQNTIVFIDAVHSAPQLPWVEKSKIVFNGREMRLLQMKEEYARSTTVHHWELICR